AARPREVGLFIVRPGVPAEWIAGCARLANSDPPSGWPPHRWSMLKRDAVAFLEVWGGEAAHLGWSALDLFGIDRTAPYARVDSMGLVPLLNGREVVDLTHDTAAIHRSSGGVLTYRRDTASKMQAEGARTQMVCIWLLQPTSPVEEPPHLAPEA